MPEVLLVDRAGALDVAIDRVLTDEVAGVAAADQEAALGLMARLNRLKLDAAGPDRELEARIKATKLGKEAREKALLEL